MTITSPRILWLGAISAILFAPLSPLRGAPGDEQRTTQVLENAVKADPGNADLWLHLGFAYRKLSQLDSALTAFEKAASLNPQGTDARYMLGLIYESKQQTAAAEKYWKEYLAIERDPAKRQTAENHLHRLSQ